MTRVNREWAYALFISLYAAFYCFVFGLITLAGSVVVIIIWGVLFEEDLIDNFYIVPQKIVYSLSALGCSVAMWMFLRVMADAPFLSFGVPAGWAFVIAPMAFLAGCYVWHKHKEARLKSEHP